MNRFPDTFQTVTDRSMFGPHVPRGMNTLTRWLTIPDALHKHSAHCPAVDANEEPPEEWEAEDDVKERPLDPREVKNASEKEIKYLWDMEVYEYSTEAGGTGTNRTPSSWPQVDRYEQRKCRSPTLPFASGAYGGAP